MTAHDDVTGGDAQPLEVTFYPQRVARSTHHDPLTPSQALHLAREGAVQADHAAPRRLQHAVAPVHAAHPPAPAAPAPAPAAPAPAPAAPAPAAAHAPAPATAHAPAPATAHAPAAAAHTPTSAPVPPPAAPAAPAAPPRRRWWARLWPRRRTAGVPQAVTTCPDCHGDPGTDGRCPLGHRAT